MKLKTKILYAGVIAVLTVNAGHKLQAQAVDYLRVIPANSPSLSIEEKLVRLAWQNYPQNRIIEAQYNISEESLIQAKWSWLDEIRVQGNLNEFSINPPELENGRVNLFPRYNVGVAFSPGMVVRIPSQIRQAKEQVTIAEEQINSQKLAVRNLVLARYQNYILYKRLLEIDTKSMEQSNTAYDVIEQKFKRGNIGLDEYNVASEDRNNRQKAQISAEIAYLKSKYDLEEVIGVPIETVLQK